MPSSRTFLTRFHEYCRRRRLLDERDKVIVAVSGGVDSVVLLDLLVRERSNLGLELIVAHFNHQLRGDESAADEAFVAERARQHGLEAYIERAHTAEIARQRGMGIQEAARQLRYAFFEQLLTSSGFTCIATAHNADDNAETILMNLFRGSGVPGLAGIPVYRHDTRVVRPLLFAPRAEIEDYASAEGITHRDDSSNATDHYTRNLIRHRILPVVREHINPSVATTLHRSAELFRELESFLSAHARRSMDFVVTRSDGEEVHLSIQRLRSHPVLVQQYIILQTVEDIAHRRLEHDTVTAVLGLTEGLTGTWIQVSERHVVFRDREALVFRTTQAFRDFRLVVQTNQRYRLGEFSFATELLDRHPGAAILANGAEYVDADRLRARELVLRTWREGDAFVPLGMKTKKKISDFFVDAKIPLFDKRSYPVLETRDGDIVWLCGQRIDDRFKVTEATRRVLRMEFTRSGKGDDGPIL
jgi:tRNA(Ile)-lysidine synthase